MATRRLQTRPAVSLCAVRTVYMECVRRQTLASVRRRGAVLSAILVSQRTLLKLQLRLEIETLTKVR